MVWTLLIALFVLIHLFGAKTLISWYFVFLNIQISSLSVALLRNELGFFRITASLITYCKFVIRVEETNKYVVCTCNIYATPFLWVLSCSVSYALNLNYFESWSPRFCLTSFLTYILHNNNSMYTTYLYDTHWNVRCFISRPHPMTSPFAKEATRSIARWVVAAWLFVHLHVLQYKLKAYCGWRKNRVFDK